MYLRLRCWQNKHVQYCLWRCTRFYSRTIIISHLCYNDLHKASSIILKLVMFADDTNLFLSNKDINKLFNDMNFELQKNVNLV